MSAKIYVGSVVRACVVFSALRRLPFFMNGEGPRPLIVTFVFYVSNLSWNVDDNTLSDVRLISFFLALPVSLRS
jgi:hypothetical protein